jgi:DNA-binding NtrC family response regulator
MSEASLLTGKKVLIVDDEPDVLDSIEQLLPTCAVTKAGNFEEARKLLEEQAFDVAVLDIMGVEGYKLLEIANRRKVIAVMLTAHALSPENIVKSFKGGAASYLPKEEILHLEAFLEEILESKKKGKTFWSRWLDRWGSYYDVKFGPGWQDKDKDFWDRFRKYP